MNERRLLSIVFVVLAASSLALGSTGFTSVTADRAVDVSVVDQQEAYVGVVACAKSDEAAERANPVRVWVTNRFTEPVTVTRIVGDTTSTYVPPSPHQTIEPGQERRYEPNFATHTVTIHVDGEGLDAEVTAPVHQKDSCPVQAPSNGTNSTTQNSTKTTNTTNTTE